VLVGLGLGIWARARGFTQLSAIAFAGGLLHIWNHAAMKDALFLGGKCAHGAGTKDVELLGGLLRRMKWTGRGMVVGAVAIAGLPPLNGFTGEWLLYRGLTQHSLSGSTPSGLAAMTAAAVLALVGGLAAMCFVRSGSSCWGVTSENAARAHESP
jgi:formate hydrogenlyase subunit 3/multisubunit Na+/H+ antiporter MnhD subunit